MKKLSLLTLTLIAGFGLCSCNSTPELPADLNSGTTVDISSQEAAQKILDIINKTGEGVKTEANTITLEAATEKCNISVTNLNTISLKEESVSDASINLKHSGSTYFGIENPYGKIKDVKAKFAFKEADNELTFAMTRNDTPHQISFKADDMSIESYFADSNLYFNFSNTNFIKGLNDAGNDILDNLSKFGVNLGALDASTALLFLTGGANRCVKFPIGNFVNVNDYFLPQEVVNFVKLEAAELSNKIKTFFDENQDEITRVVSYDNGAYGINVSLKQETVTELLKPYLEDLDVEIDIEELMEEVDFEMEPKVEVKSVFDNKGRLRLVDLDVDVDGAIYNTTFNVEIDTSFKIEYGQAIEFPKNFDGYINPFAISLN